MNDTDNPGVSGEAETAAPAAPPESPPSARDKRGRFQKGAPSANPRGRPTESHELKVLAREKSPEAIKRLLFWMRSDDSTASIAAAKELLSRGYGRPEQGITLDATVAQKRRYPAIMDMDAVDASAAYSDFIRSPDGTVEFAEPEELSPEEFYAQMMRISPEKERLYAERALAKRTFSELVEAGRKAAESTPERRTLSPPSRPQVLAAPPEMVQAPTSPAAPATAPPERSSAVPAPREAAADPDDLSVVLVIEEPLRHFHEHVPKPDSSCPRCRQLWVTS